VFLKILLDYILGYVNVKVESFFTERFINVSISKKILLWNIKRENDVIFTANVGVGEYRKLREVAKKTNSKVSIVAKKGVPFIMHRYRKRKLFAMFLMIIIIAIIVSREFHMEYRNRRRTIIPKRGITS